MRIYRRKMVNGKKKVLTFHAISDIFWSFYCGNFFIIWHVVWLEFIIITDTKFNIFQIIKSQGFYKIKTFVKQMYISNFYICTHFIKQLILWNKNSSNIIEIETFKRVSAFKEEKNYQWLLKKKNAVISLKDFNSSDFNLGSADNISQYLKIYLSGISGQYFMVS